MSADFPTQTLNKRLLEARRRYTIGMSRMAFRGFLAFIAFAASVTPLQLEAQALGSTDPLTLDVSPLYPKPYQTVTITPGSTVIDLSASIVTVSVNGQPVAKGSGAQDVAIQVGGIGELTKVVVTAVTNGQTYSKELDFRPADVSLIEEPISTTHAFYKGGSLVASEGRVRLIAIPDLRTSPGNALSASNLIYTWKLGDQVLESSSGIGRFVLNATAPVRYRDADVTVTVTNADNTLVAQTTTTVSPVDPIVRTYQSDPLLGPLYDNALQSVFTMTDAEESFRAIGYFFASKPTLAWTVNDAASGGSPDLTVRSTGNGTGSAALAVTATLPDSSQSADTRFLLQFGDKQPLGIFGL